MPGVSIRPLDTGDVARYHALRQRGLAEHPEAFSSSAEEESKLAHDKLAARVARSSDRPLDTVLGAFDGDALVGICGMRVDPRAKVRHRGHVFGMYVPRERCGRGIGAGLLHALFEHAARGETLDALVLTVTATNSEARTLYERHGFAAFGCEPGAVRIAGRSYDKVHMIRWLARSPAPHPATDRHGEGQ
jgi:ribosomal protein S18 acetylase RimI-like enzyme